MRMHEHLPVEVLWIFDGVVALWIHMQTVTGWQSY